MLAKKNQQTKTLISIVFIRTNCLIYNRMLKTMYFIHEQKQSFSPTEKKFNFCVEINKINIVIMPARFDLKQLFL
jgi:hypothetical protein